MRFDFRETGSARVFDQLDRDEPSDAPTLPSWIHVEFAQFGRSRGLRSEVPQSHYFVAADCNQKVAAGFTPRGYFSARQPRKAKS